MKKLFCFFICLIFLVCPLPTKALSVSAKSAVLIDAVSGEILFSKNPNEKLSMASTTKIMTALLLCENGDLERKITVTPEMVYVEGTSMGLKVGMQVSLEDILYGMILASGNDAANAAAIAIGGGIDNFVALMNDKARQLGLECTHFNTPSGLDGDSHYTTSFDLAMLTRYALNNSDFYKACSTKSKTVVLDGVKVTLKNHNRLLSSYNGAIGVKTGFTKKSGRCLVSAAERDGGRLIAVTLNDGNDWQDHKSMLDYGFSRLNATSCVFNETEYKIPVLAGKEQSVTAHSERIELRTLEGKTVVKKEYIYPYICAPVKEGEVVGYIEYKSGGYTVAKQTLYAEKCIEANDSISFIKRIKNTFFVMFKYV